MLKATKDFSAAIGRDAYRMKKGQVFQGHAEHAERLSRLGLLKEAASRSTKKED